MLAGFPGLSYADLKILNIIRITEIFGFILSHFIFKKSRHGSKLMQVKRP